MRVLHIKCGLGRDGASIIILRLAKYMSPEVKFDWLVEQCSDEEIKKDFMDLGGKVIVMPSFGKNKIKMMLYILNFLKNNKYDVAHVGTEYSGKWKHMVLLWISGVKCRIIHSHNSETQSISKFHSSEIYRNVSKFLLRVFSTDYFSCSDKAGEYLFDRKTIKSDKYKIIKNGLDPKEYCFNKQVREEVRNELNIGPNTIVFGHIGRIEEVKNHKFMVELFKKFHDDNPDSVMWFIGDGQDRSMIENKVSENNLKDSVVFFGKRNDVSRLLQAMDVFILPSLFEGLSLVSIEAQAAGLKVYVSDNQTTESKITDNISFLPLSKGADYWKSYIEDEIKNGYIRKDMSKEVENSGFDITETAQKLKEFYLSKAQ